MVETRSIPRGIARWLVRSADHVTRSDRYDRHADQCYGDDAVQCYPRGNDTV